MGVGSACSVIPTHPIHVLVPDLRAGASSAARCASPSLREPLPLRRYRHRHRKLTSADEGTIGALAETKSLRTLAADFAVSHETIRSIIKRELGQTALVPVTAESPQDDSSGL